MRSAYLVALVIAMALAPGLKNQTTDCNTSCDDRCRISLPVGSVVEPACKSSCEIHKAASCRVGTPVPDPVPPPPGPGTCGQIFNDLNDLVITKCQVWDARQEDQMLIEGAKNLLVDADVVRREEFDGLTIRWCAIAAYGIAPNNGRIYLSLKAKTDHPVNRASLLAHEMTHIRQYRRMGAVQFSCQYSQQYIAAGGRQDESLPLEAEAYNHERDIYPRLMQQYQKVVVPPPPPPPQQLPSGAALSQCGCWGFASLGATRPAPQCSSGLATPRQCPGVCPAGGFPWVDTCF
jgi:hypothetical protein